MDSMHIDMRVATPGKGPLSARSPWIADVAEGPAPHTASTDRATVSEAGPATMSTTTSATKAAPSLTRALAVSAFVALSLVGCTPASVPHAVAQASETQFVNPSDEMAKPADPYFARFHPLRPPPATSHLLLKKGDRLALIGDSITEQRRYARMIETYITVTRPDLEVSVRNEGKSSEALWSLPERLDRTILPFDPTIATVTYGMNDSRYMPYSKASADTYHDNLATVVHKLDEAHVRVVVGSDGPLSKRPPWSHTPGVTSDDMTYHLSTLRNEAVTVAREQNKPYADVFWNMSKARYNALHRFGPEYAQNIFGAKDGVHPEWAGHVPMAYAYLKALGFDGNVGTITLDLSNGRATASEGHHVDGSSRNSVTVTSERYPFCADGPLDKPDSVRSGMQLVPFNQDLNRFTLRVTGATARSYTVTWGGQSRVYTREELTRGINLANDFTVNPFSKHFQAVDEAVGAKQAVESDEVWNVFDKFKGGPGETEALQRDEALRTQRVADIKAAFVPVTYQIQVQAR